MKQKNNNHNTENMKRRVICALLFLLYIAGHAQTVEQLKQSSDYLCGEGWGESLKQADQSALHDLISKISVNVQSSFLSSESEITQNDKLDSKARYESVVNTYSQATLTNTNRIIIKNEPNAQVLRYVKKVEIARIFEGRKNKVLDMVECAQRAERTLKIDDALRYYYWSLCLLKSLQYSNEVKITDAEGKQRLLATWIPEQINSILGNIRIQKVGQKKDIIELSCTYKDKPVASLDFTYFDGIDWSNICSAQDGRAMAEMRPGQIPDNLNVKCEYEFSGEAHIDKEIETVMQVMKGTAFRDSYKNVSLTTTESAAQPVPVTNSATVLRNAPDKNNTIKEITDTKPYLETMQQICNAITTKSYQPVQPLFTSDGWNSFLKLVAYGSATIYGKPDFVFLPMGDKIVCRSLPMNFTFRNNKRKFMEQVTFTFNKDKKIDNIAFGLGNTSEKDIMLKGAWTEQARMSIMNFLEDYKTAYALKDMDYIRNVFDDNAVIITGRVVRRPQNKLGDSNTQMFSDKVIKFTRQTKDQYIKNLAYCFASNEFINIRFANNDVVKMGVGGEVYGIQIKQDYYSTNYGDTGFLFLMVDLNNPQEPIIKVRTWQPEKDPNFGLIDASDF